MALSVYKNADGSPSDEAVIGLLRWWGMQPADFDAAKEWYALVTQNKYWTKAKMIPLPIDGISGLLVVMSTKESNKAFHDSVSKNANHCMVTDPEWLYFAVYWYPGLALWNIAGLMDPKYVVSETPRPLWCLLETIFQKRGNPNWRQQYCTMDHGAYHDSFRTLLLDIGVKVWVELTTGLSYQQFRALDAYCKTFAAGVAAPTEESWYLLNTEVMPPIERRQLWAEEWYYCTHWRSWGQRQSITEHDLVDNREKYALARAAQAFLHPYDAVANNRISRTLGHLGYHVSGLGHQPLSVEEMRALRMKRDRTGIPTAPLPLKDLDRKGNL